MRIARIGVADAVLFLAATSAGAANFDVKVQTANGQSSITVPRNSTVKYRLLATVDQTPPLTASEGLALWSCDLTLSGSPTVTLLPANCPSQGAAIGSFDAPRGVANPKITATDPNCLSDYGGTRDQSGAVSKLVQLGGAQNTIRNVASTDAPFPNATSIVTNFAVVDGTMNTPQMVAVGTIAFGAAGTYTLSASNILANVIRDGEAGTVFYKTERVASVSTTALTITVSNTATLTTIISANPPLAIDNPYVPGAPFRDVLQTGTTSSLTQGIGGVQCTAPNTPPGCTPNEGAVQYSRISVTFGATPSPAPSTTNIGVVCTGPGSYPCPTVTNVSGSGPGPYTLTLSNVIPPKDCTTFTFAGTMAGEKLQYQSLPADVTLDGISNTQDMLAIIQAINGDGVLSINLARYDVDRNGFSNTNDMLRIIQLLNGTLTTEAWNGKTVTACP